MHLEVAAYREGERREECLCRAWGKWVGCVCGGTSSGYGAHGQILEALSTLSGRSRNWDFNCSKSYIIEMNFSVLKGLKKNLYSL